MNPGLLISRVLAAVEDELDRRRVPAAAIARETGLTEATVSRALARIHDPSVATLCALAGWAEFDLELIPRKQADRAVA